MTEKTIPTWGYPASGEAKIFNLVEGDDLPEGWADSPAAYHDTDNKPANAGTEIDEARAAALRQKGADAATENKPRKAPPAYSGKPEGALWLEGYDGVKPQA